MVSGVVVACCGPLTLVLTLPLQLETVARLTLTLRRKRLEGDTSVTDVAAEVDDAVAMMREFDDAHSTSNCAYAPMANAAALSRRHLTSQ